MQKTFIRYFLPPVISGRLGFLANIALIPIFLPFLVLRTIASPAIGFEIDGVILDSTGAAVAGAEAVLRPITGAGEWRVRSDSTGRFVIRSVTDGQYMIRVSAPGFSETERRVTVAGQNVDLTITLLPATVSEAVSVRAESYQERETSIGSRVDTPLIELPQSITVVNRQLLSDQAVVTLEEALKNVAGVKAGGYHRGWDYYRIRGFDASFTTFIDGLRVDPGLGEEMFGLERVEVIKGPTSALYGQAVLGGIVNLQSKRPRPETFADIQLTGGSFNFYEAAVDAGSSLNKSHTLYGRLNALYRPQKSFVDFAKNHRWYLAPAITWDATPATTVTALSRLQFDRVYYGFPLPAKGTVLPNLNIEELAKASDAPGGADPVKKPEPRLYRVIWRWHFYAGLITLPVLLTAAVTGGLYVFREELERVIYPQLMFVEPQPQIISYNEQLAKGAAALPSGATVHGISISDDPTRATGITAEIGPERYVSVYVNQHTGEVLGRLEYNRSLFGVILNIHRTLLAGTTGRVVVELATSWGIILIVTGLYLWWPRVGSKALGVWLPRLRGKSYVIWRDWHTVPGFYFSLLAFLVMGTGLFFTLVFARGYQAVAHMAGSYPASYLNPPKSVRKESAVRLGVDEIIAVARREQSQKEMYVDFPHTAEDSFTIYAGSYDSPSTLTFLYLDQYSGAALDAIRWRDISVVAKVQVSAYSIHIGSIYGLPTKILASLACVLIVVTSVTGAAMWWTRRPRGKTGFPLKPVEIKPAKWLIAVICLLGVLMPAAGVSMLLILFGDWAARRRRDKQRRAPGLV